MRVVAAVKRFLREEHGATVVEYALMILLIALACVGAVTAFGTAVQGMYTSFTPIP